MFLTCECGHGPDNKWFGIQNSSKCTHAIYEEPDATYLRFIPVGVNEPNTYYLKALACCEADERWLGPSADGNWIHARYTDLAAAAKFRVDRQDHNNSNAENAAGI